jgi:hypothetical protein
VMVWPTLSDIVFHDCQTSSAVTWAIAPDAVNKSASAVLPAKVNFAIRTPSWMNWCAMVTGTTALVKGFAALKRGAKRNCHQGGPQDLGKRHDLGALFRTNVSGARHQTTASIADTRKPTA